MSDFACFMVKESQWDRFEDKAYEMGFRLVVDREYYERKSFNGIYVRIYASEDRHREIWVWIDRTMGTCAPKAVKEHISELRKRRFVEEVEPHV